MSFIRCFIIIIIIIIIIINLGVLSDSKLLLHHVDCVFSKSLKTLGLEPTLTYSFSTVDGLLLFYVTVVRSALEYASPV